jgi:hypothetical protein
MDNPFKKRATEYFEDPAAFLSLVSPEPVRSFFSKDYEQLFDRSVIVAGSPGSGKTTIAQLIEFDSLLALSAVATNGESRALASELANFKILNDLVPTVLAFRLPAGSTLRDIWELPYSEQVKSAILRSFIQARAVLGWLRKLEKAKVPPHDIHVITRDHLDTLRNMIRADDIGEFKAFAREVETKIFKVVTALVPPPEADLVAAGLDSTYQAFDAIEAFVVDTIPGISLSSVRLRPLFILDDAHELHPSQFADVEAWLRKRELKVARWIMTRIDAIRPEDLRSALTATEQDPAAGTTAGRDRVIKLMQKDRRDRGAFRKVARDIAKRYIEQMPALRRHVSKLEECLDARHISISAANLKTLSAQVATLRDSSGLPEHIIRALESSIPKGLPTDQHLGVLRILLNREIRKTPQADLFGVGEGESVELIVEEDDILEEEKGDGEQAKVKRRGAALLAGASLQLHHEFDRPYYYSFEMLADSSSENIEQFIHLAGALVDVVETKLLRGQKPLLLDAKLQHQILVGRARETIKRWDFPHSQAVRRIVDFISMKCLEKTRQPNAPLSDGANAFGIPQAEMDRLHKEGGSLIRILHFALAYNAISVREGYECKKRTWCLFILGGLPTLASGLTLNMGGFCEGRLSDLISCVDQDG